MSNNVLHQKIRLSAEAIDQNRYRDLSPIDRLRKINWIPALFIISFHIGALAAFWTFSWQALGVCLVLHWISGGLGITLTYHRLLTHKSMEVPKALKYFLCICASLACQGGPISWVGVHRLHHKTSDSPQDPHTPVGRGFFWSHMGWCMTKNMAADHFENYSQLAPDLVKDKGLVFLDRVHIMWTFLLAGLLYLWGGWSFVVWGIFVRTVLVWHCTWFVNSASHLWGYKTYDSKDDSRNLWWVALITYGEGWHNNHHAFQHSARHGLRWWEIDTTYITIRILEFLGLAKSVKLPAQQDLARRALAARS